MSRYLSRREHGRECVTREAEDGGDAVASSTDDNEDEARARAQRSRRLIAGHAPGVSRRVLAAGGVVWRRVDDRIQVLLVYRKKFRDLSFAKGKVDPGETFPETAVREIAEETGIRGELGPPLGCVEYHLPSGREKVVHYWAVEATPEAIEASEFTPNKEIAALEWLSLKKARKKVSYPVDREVLTRFEELIAADGLDTFPVVLLRHGSAGSAPVDSERPLAPRGEKQAKAVVRPLKAFGVRRIIASSALRCQQTVAPLSKKLGRRVHVSDAISQDAWAAQDGDVASIVAKRIRKQKGSVLCSHGPVLPEIMEAIASETGTPPSTELRRAAALDTGSFTVVHVRRGGAVVAIETHAPLSDRRPT